MNWFQRCYSWWQAWVHLNKTNHPWCKQTTNRFPLFFFFLHISKTLVSALTIKLSLANSNNDDRHGEFSCLSWTRRTVSQLSLRCLEEHLLYFLEKSLTSEFLSEYGGVTFPVICIFLPMIKSVLICEHSSPETPETEAIIQDKIR